VLTPDKQREGMMSDMRRKTLRDLPHQLALALRGEKLFDGERIPNEITALVPGLVKVAESLALAATEKALGQQQATREKVAAKNGTPVPVPVGAETQPAKPEAPAKPEKPAGRR
jgi:hypothetical protein